MRLGLIIVTALISTLALSPVAVTAAEPCESCGESIDGPFFETKGYRYHPEHFVCAHCQEPIQGQYTTYKSQNYHPDCFKRNVALRCSLCSEIISGQHLLDHWGNAYHVEHKKEALCCDFCTRFVTPDLYEGGVRFSDGRFLCRLCNPTAVRELAEAKTIVADVASRMRRFGLTVDINQIHLHLVGRKRMQELSSNHSHGLRGFTDYRETKNLFGRVLDRQIDVYLLYGMPQTEMVGTAAHELTHVWQFLQGKLDQDRALSEGSCNFTAYLVLKDVNSNESRYMIANLAGDQDRIYGEGFRRVKRYAESNGISGWLNLMKKRRPKLPK